MATLVKPSIEYKDSFIEAIKEFQASGQQVYLHSDIDPDSIKEGFEKFLSEIKEREESINLPEGRVPQTELWLVDAGEFIGWVKIRHKLNENLLTQGGHIGYAVRPSKRKIGYGTMILQMSLPFAKKLGIEKVLITCNDDNIGSAKIIENNGGIMENKVVNEEGKLKRRYWIENK